MTDSIKQLSERELGKSTYDLEILKGIKDNPNAEIEIYRATVGNTINDGDWIFINPEKAKKWTKTALGTPKPGVKVVKMKVKAKQVAWTGKNLEFMYQKGGKKGSN